MTWDLTDHCCRVCFGRVLEREDKAAPGAERWRYRCAECGAAGVGWALSICFCGAKVGNGPGLECVRNPAAPTQEVPHEVVVRQRVEQRKERDRTVPARVEIGSDRGFLG